MWLVVGPNAYMRSYIIYREIKSDVQLYSKKNLLFKNTLLWTLQVVWTFDENGYSNHVVDLCSYCETTFLGVEFWFGSNIFIWQFSESFVYR